MGALNSSQELQMSYFKNGLLQSAHSQLAETLLPLAAQSYLHITLWNFLYLAGFPAVFPLGCQSCAGNGIAGSQAAAASCALLLLLPLLVFPSQHEIAVRREGAGPFLSDLVPCQQGMGVGDSTRRRG